MIEMVKIWMIKEICMIEMEGLVMEEEVIG